MFQSTELSKKCATLVLFWRHQKFSKCSLRLFLVSFLNWPVLLSHWVFWHRLLRSSDILQVWVFCIGVSICGFLANKNSFPSSFFLLLNGGFCNIDWWALANQWNFTFYLFASSSLSLPKVVMKHLFDYFWKRISPFSKFCFNCLLRF